MNIGILAYGSLITDPGTEIQAATQETIQEVLTPFCVEYARKSHSRNDAPTLVPVPCEFGGQVKGSVFILHEKFGKQDAVNMLYRREIHQVGTNKPYNTQSSGDLHIEFILNFKGVPLVIYAALKPNFQEIISPYLTPQQKAQLLADAAINSLSAKTYPNRTDGISYLNDNIHNAINTPLTRLYAEKILRRANTENLMQARDFFASQKKLPI